MRVDDIGILACPETRNPLVYQGTNLEGVLQDGVLICRETGVAWGVEESWPRLVRELRLDGPRERLLKLHDFAPRLHDPLVRTLCRALRTTPELAARTEAFRLLDLPSLRASADGPARVLEVGTGAGGGLAAVEQQLPDGVDVQLWGTDVSFGMLQEARRRFNAEDPSGPLHQARLLLAEAAGLPFGDGSFDRVVHLGGLAGFRDARAALAEMARVARSGTPVVVPAANPGPDAPLGIPGNAARKLLPAVPDGALADLVPPSAGDVEVRRLDPLFMLLRFTAP